MTGQLSLYFVTFALTAYLIATVAFAIDLTRKAPKLRRLESGAALTASGATAAPDPRVQAASSGGDPAGVSAVADGSVAVVAQAVDGGALVGAAGGDAAGGGTAGGGATGGGTAGGGATRGPDAGVPGAGERRRAGGIAMATFLAGTGLLLAGVITRGIAAGRAPWANMYEFTLMSVLVAAVVFVVIQSRRDVRYLGTFVAGACVVFIFLALTVLYLDPVPVQPALQSYWLIIHVSVATAAVGLSTVGAVVSAVQLVKERHEVRGSAPKAAWAKRVIDSLPSADSLERLAYRINAVGFIMWTFALIAGSIWAERAWGRFWGWDAKEVWTLVTWIIYAAYLHARATRGWEGRRAAWFSIAGFASIIVNYWIINQFVNSLHSYSGL